MSKRFFDVIIWCSEFVSQVFSVQENERCQGICTVLVILRERLAGGLMAEKEIISGAQLETTATEESPVASRTGEILRRPMIVCQTTE
jgi:hypothetical protein